MSQAVLADAQFGIVHILRPFAGFEAKYEGQPSSTPIMFSPEGHPLDPLAGTPGYSPQLLRGLSVPLGARIVLWLPAIFATSVNPPVVIPYAWFVEWRLRNTFDYRQRRIPFHLAKQTPGAPDTTFPVGQQARVIIPAAQQPVVYNQSEPVSISARVTQNVRGEDVSPRLGYVTQPLLPDGTLGVYQQGLLDPATFGPVASEAIFLPHELQALGDELLIGVYRTADSQGNWEFTTPPQVDALFSILFGNGSGKTFPEIGVYVLSGTAP